MSKTLEIVRVVHKAYEIDPFERDPSKIRSNLDVIAHRLGQCGMVFSKVRGAIEFRGDFEFGDPNTVWLAEDSSDDPAIIDPHHPVFDTDARRAMKQYAVSGDRDSYTKLKKLPLHLPSKPEVFSLGQSSSDLRQRGVIYWPSQAQLN